MSELTPREVFTLRLHQPHGAPHPLLGATTGPPRGAQLDETRAVPAGALRVLERPAPLSKLRQPEVVNALRLPEVQRKVNPRNLPLIRRHLLVPKTSNSDRGVEQALQGLPVGGVREKIRVLAAVLQFLQELGKKGAFQVSKYKKGKIQVDPLQLTKNAVWAAATTAVPALRIVKSVAERIIKAVLKRMRIWYNNKCSGKAGGAIRDAANVRRSSSMDRRCGRADGEPQWVARGFKPYVWRTAVSTSKWSYSPLGWSKDKKSIKELLEKRKRRGRRAPPEAKAKAKKSRSKKGRRKGGRNLELYGACPLPGAATGR